MPTTISQAAILIMENGAERKASPRAIIAWLSEDHRRRLGNEDADAMLRILKGRGTNKDRNAARAAITRLANSKRLAAEHRTILNSALGVRG